LENIVGLDSVMFPHGGQSGLVMLRTLLQKTGLRDLERKATYAIERNKARWERQTPESLAERFDGWAKLVFFEWTTDYGLQPSRAFVILLGIVVILSTVYTVPIAASPTHSSNAHGVFRVWPAERIELNGKNVRVANDARVERLTAGIPAVFGWALYFSLLSAFHIGWRELNVGSWISRIQPREFVLRGQGWVRMISGIQSIISLYLIAIWALTYFGRPFE
jgi:hypothetical protein